MKKCKGNVGDIMTTGICILAMTVVMLCYMESVTLLNQKAAVGQLARKYILKMETVGYLTEADSVGLIQELETMGVSEANLEGTTLNAVSYGAPIALRIKGKLRGEYVFEERRVSTAKN